ncbi:MAG TPA: hypothetical protein VGC74_09170 [Stenotrophomonas sp.]|jgi:hypothetical protein
MGPWVVVSALVAVAIVALAAAALTPAWGTAVTAGVAALLLLAMWRRQWSGVRGGARWSDLELLEALDDGAPIEGRAPARPEHLPSLAHFDPSMAARLPWRDMEIDEVLTRLRSKSDAWRQARALEVQRRHRRRHLELAICLLEQGVPLPGAAVPDLAALRAEAFLLQADPGQPVLADVAALQARRLQWAVASADPSRQPALQAQWDRLETLFALMPTALHLREQAWRVHRLAWNPRADLDQVDVAYAQAREYAQLLDDWLRSASAVVLVGGTTLEAHLRSKCLALQNGAGDDIAQVEAAQSLWPAFQQVVDGLLSELMVEAVRIEARVAATEQA